MAALRTDIDIAVFDAANCTRAWRRWIRQQVQEAGLYAQTIFIEAQCESGELIASNIHQTILRSPEVINDNVDCLVDRSIGGLSLTHIPHRLEPACTHTHTKPVPRHVGGGGDGGLRAEERALPGHLRDGAGGRGLLLPQGTYARPCFVCGCWGCDAARRLWGSITPHRLSFSSKTKPPQVVDGNRKIVAHRINGYIPGRIMLLLANIHTKPRPIWFSRHGESQFNAMGRIGGDSPLSPRGMLYAQKLNDFISSVYPRRSVWANWTDGWLFLWSQKSSHLPLPQPNTHKKTATPPTPRRPTSRSPSGRRPWCARA